MEEDDDGDDPKTEVPLFLCQHNGHTAELHLHTFADDVLYHIRWDAFTSCGSHNLQLTSKAAKHWNSHNKPATNKVLAALPKLKILSGKLSKQIT